jgi:hypothetical protein
MFFSLSGRLSVSLANGAKYLSHSSMLDKSKRGFALMAVGIEDEAMSIAASLVTVEVWDSLVAKVLVSLVAAGVLAALAVALAILFDLLVLSQSNKSKVKRHNFIVDEIFLSIFILFKLL